jgi:hypothetical protein
MWWYRNVHVYVKEIINFPFFVPSGYFVVNLQTYFIYSVDMIEERKLKQQFIFLHESAKSTQTQIYLNLFYLCFHQDHKLSEVFG